MNHTKTSWLWLDEYGTRGLVFDTSTQTLHWYTEPENLCGDDGSTFEQTPQSFLQGGTPSIVGRLPNNIRLELLAALEASGSLT